MRVKVGGVWFSSETEPVCIQISEKEQEQIASMDRSVSINGKYAVFPEHCEMDIVDKLVWMRG